MGHLFVRTDSDNKDFISLVALLDADLRMRDGEDHGFYAQFNKIDMLQHVLVYYVDNRPVGCGAFKKFNTDSVEIKRMYVLPENRGQAIGKKILNELEVWAKELQFHSCMLETGKKQPEAIALYKSAGYKIISNYGQYANVENSVCMKKVL